MDGDGWSVLQYVRGIGRCGCEHIWRVARMLFFVFFLIILRHPILGAVRVTCSSSFEHQWV